MVLLMFFLVSLRTQAQELNCNVQVRTNNIQVSNKEIFNELQNSIRQFMNNRQWTNEKFQFAEKINCNLIINVTTYSVDNFRAEVNIQSNRPVYGTTYTTPILNYFDQNWTFQYTQFQALEFQEGANIDQLTSLLAFYAYIIIGIDFDTYALRGGTDYYNKAMAIRNAAINEQGWGARDGKGNRNRYYLIDNLLDERFRPFRTALYQYHMKGLDQMREDVEEGQRQVFQALENIRKSHRDLPNAMIIRLFFQAKQKELMNVFTQTTPGMRAKAVELLGIMDPANRNEYEKIGKS
jgi:hypothetical protein